ncbi:helix-turn-helix domain-containing protein [Enterococcus crotali]|uniref:helix-turn-helix domain-containing protein n=1 Tax=Enterococcus crotali TaxID=1453587 RepID=UPI00047188EF|nr:Rgg/GadR/MutR family transcriptional regulator [Enterococcus crotali]
MPHFGKTIKSIRISRAISQEELCRGVMSRSNLSRFENQLYIPSFDKVLKLLDRLTVTLDEFIYIDRNFLPSRYDHYYQKLVKAENYQNKKELQVVSKQIAENKEESTEFYELFLLSQLALIDNNLTAVLTLEEITTYMRPILFNLENWLFFDFRRLNNFLRLFDVEEAIFLYDRAIKEFAKYEGFTKENNIKIHLSLNMGQLLLDAELPEKAIFYLRKAKQYSQQKNKVYQELISDIFIEKILHGKGERYRNRSYSDLTDLLLELGYESFVQSLVAYTS